MDLEEYIPVFQWPKDTSRFVFVRAERGDAQLLNDLYNRVFTQQRPLVHFDWKYWRTPAGPPYGVIAKAREDGRALAAAFGQRRLAWIGGRSVPGNLMCEISSDPSARGGGVAFKGVMQAIGIGLNDEAGILWSYGGQANDDAIVVGSRWLGFHEAFTLRIWEMRLSLEPALRARLGAAGAALARLLDPIARALWQRSPGGMRCEEVREFGPEFDALWERFRDRYALCFARDAATLRWRWFENPVPGHRVMLARDASGAPLGWIVWREWQPAQHRLATVLDLWAGGAEDTVMALVDAARRAAARNGCQFLRYGVKQDSPEMRALQRLGHGRVSPHDRPDRVIVTPMPGSLHDETAADFEIWRTVVRGENWYYTQGDSDFYD